jgi:palmitoyltransferase ZDHHC13/17
MLIGVQGKKEIGENWEVDIYNWVNARTTKEGFTALHFASFRGNIRIIRLLIGVGANINVRNNYGINLMHIAAQGDQTHSLVTK